MFDHVAEALRWGEGRLRQAGIAGARLQATRLLGHALQLDRAALLARLREPLSDEAATEYRRLVARRARREPLQYLVGSAPFLDFELEVGPGVFIPRPETELVVEAALERWTPSETGTEGGWAVEVGTGSGAIAVALARSRPAGLVCSIDRSATALGTALRNARRLDVADRVCLVRGDLLSPLGITDVPAASDGGPRRSLPRTIRRRVGLLVSNPPYAAREDVRQPEVRDHEPEEAWAAGPEGTEVYARLIPQAAELLLPGRPLVLELGYGQAGAVPGLLAEDGRWEEPEIEADARGVPRILTTLRR